MVKMIIDILTSKHALKIYYGVCFVYGTIKGISEIEGNPNIINLPKIITYGGVSFFAGYIIVHLEKYLIIKNK